MRLTVTVAMAASVALTTAAPATISDAYRTRP